MVIVFEVPQICREIGVLRRNSGNTEHGVQFFAKISLKEVQTLTVKYIGKQQNWAYLKSNH